MAILVNDKDVALQASPYRNKTTLVAVSSTVSNFTVAKNGGPVSPSSTVLTATPNIVFTNAATYTWDYSLNTSPTTWKGFIGGLIAGTTTFIKSGISINGIGTYNGVTGTTSGAGTGAVFNIAKGVTGTNYNNTNITIVNGGTGYQPGDTITIPGTSLGYLSGGLLSTNTFTRAGTSVTTTGTYNGVAQKSTTGSGSGAIFNIIKSTSVANYSAATITVVSSGSGYAAGDQIVISGTSLGDTLPAGSLFTGSAQTFSRSGTAASAAISKTGITGTSSGSGTGAVFSITKTSGQTTYASATITVTSGGSGYAQGDTITILGSSLGTGHGNLTLLISNAVHTLSTNDLTLTVVGSTAGANANDLTLTVQGQVFSLTGTSQTISSANIKTIIGSTNATSIIFRCTVTEPLLDTATGQVVVAYSQEQANSDSINIELSKVASTISLSATGVGVYSGTDTTITVTRGGSSLVYDTNGGSTIATATANSFKVEIVQDSTVDLTVPNRTIGTYSNTTNSFVFNGITSITSDYATVTFRVIVYDASGNKTQTTYKKIQYSRVSSGLTGADAVLNYIETSAPVLIKGSASIYEIGDFVQITVNGKRTIGGVSSNYGYITITGNGDTESSTATDVSVSGITTNILNSSQKDKYIIKLYSQANTGNALLLDTQTIPVVFTGGNAISGYLSNDNVTVPVGPGNIIPSGAYDTTGTFIRVFDGATELTYGTSTKSSWRITAVTPSTGITLGTLSQVSNTPYAQLSKILAMDGVNTGTIDIYIAGYNASGKPFTLNLTQTISRGQPGLDAVLSYLEIPSPIISKSSESITTDGTYSSINITGKYVAGTAAPINAGYITASPKVKVTDFKSDNFIYCTGVSAFTIGTPIVFSGINLPSNITAGTEYYIKTINLTTKTISISATISNLGVVGTLITFAGTNQKLGLTQAYAVSEKSTPDNLTLITSIPNDAGIYSLIVKLYSSINRYTASLLDSQEILVLYKGSNTISASISNDSAGIPFTTDINGNITASTGAYDASTTIIRVFEGTTELTYNGTGTAAGTWNVTSTGTNITPGAISAVGIYAYSDKASAISAATATITFTITGKNTGGSSISLTKLQTFTRNVGGKPGNDGVGYKVNILTCYVWSTSAQVPAYNGTFNYNWSTQVLTPGTGTQTVAPNIGYPTGWTKEAGNATVDQQTLYQLTLNITAPSTDTITSGISWANAKPSRMGFRQDGSIGLVGDSARIAYTKKTLTAGKTVVDETAPTTPVGNSLPITSGGFTWTASPPTLVAGEIMYQSDGFYKPTSSTTGNITWGAPYLSSFKVGQLSAIAANLGTINAGYINIGSGRFIVNTDGQVTIKGANTTSYLEINSDVIKVYDGGLRLKLGNLDA